MNQPKTINNHVTWHLAHMRLFGKNW